MSQPLSHRTPPPASPRRRELVLVGAGHAHVQVLRSFAMAGTPPATRVTLVVDTPVAVYSGMVPGVVAGQYRPADIEIDALPLARLAGARVILAAATGVDWEARSIRLDGRPPIPYDMVSFDVGSTVAGLDLAGVREWAIPTRPIARFVARLGELEALARGVTDRPFRVVTVGGGAGGVEVAATVRERLRSHARAGVQVTLVHAGSGLLPGYPATVIARATQALAARGIRILTERAVTAVAAGAVELGSGDRLPCDALLWVTGAVAHPWMAASGLPTDPRGFLLVRDTLQLQGDDTIFAAGDCATLTAYPTTPKAGVYAVRQGPYLTHNLRAALTGRPLRRYRPQRDFLTLLNLGDGTAIGAKWGVSFAGRWVMRLKDRIDRQFMDRFQLLAEDGSPGPAVAALPAAMAAMLSDPGAATTESDSEPASGPRRDRRPLATEPSGAMATMAAMACGGCAAKLGQEALERTLGRLDGELAEPPPAPEVVLGIAEGDDVAAFRLPGGDLVVASVDAFRAFTDDPYLVGRVAALNAVSDLAAKGAHARWAQALVTLPLGEDDEVGAETLFQVLAGVRAALDPLGVVLVGGHTSRGPELAVGLAVQGTAERSGSTLLRRRGALAPGQRLLLTRPLGGGVVLHADMQARCHGPWLAATFAALAAGHGEAPAILARHGAVAATDVTGFGLAGHLAAMLGGGAVAARLSLATLPALPGAELLLTRGERSTFHATNARLRAAFTIAPELAGSSRTELLFDPQTAGGLLAILPATETETALHALRTAGAPQAVIIGELVARRPGGPLLVLDP